MPEKNTIEENKDGLALELLKEFKKIIKYQWVIIALLIVIIAVLSIYNEYQWSQFDTIVVDSGEGGYANFVDGENSGGIFNGEGYSTQAKEEQ